MGFEIKCGCKNYYKTSRSFNNFKHTIFIAFIEFIKNNNNFNSIDDKYNIIKFYEDNEKTINNYNIIIFSNYNFLNENKLVGLFYLFNSTDKNTIFYYSNSIHILNICSNN